MLKDDASLLSGREIGHFHPDASVHILLPEDVAQEAIVKGWAEVHPAAERLGRPGLVLLYTSTSDSELKVILDLIRHAIRAVMQEEN